MLGNTNYQLMLPHEDSMRMNRKIYKKKRLPVGLFQKMKSQSILLKYWGIHSIYDKHTFSRIAYTGCQRSSPSNLICYN